MAENRRCAGSFWWGTRHWAVDLFTQLGGQDSPATLLTSYRLRPSMSDYASLIRPTSAPLPSFRRKPESSQTASADRPRHKGLRFSTDSTFQAHFCLFSAFSRTMALSSVACPSYRTSVWTPYRRMNPAAASSLYCSLRRVQFRGDADGERPVASAGRGGNEGAFQVILWIPAFAGMTKGEQE